MTSPDLPPLPEPVAYLYEDKANDYQCLYGADETGSDRFEVDLLASQQHPLQSMSALITQDRAAAYGLAAYRAGMEAAAKIAGDMPITYERDGHYFNTQPEDYEAAIRRAAEEPTAGNER